VSEQDGDAMCTPKEKISRGLTHKSDFRFVKILAPALARGGEEKRKVNLP
jgi:hypothetical protein